MPVTGYITVTFKVHKEDDQYVARCIELGISTCAASLEEAEQRIEEATSLYMNTLEEVGECERVFEEAGLTINPGEPMAHDVTLTANTDDEYVSARNARLPQYAFS
jgi:predicted RNase H-like HicB family nuclease